MDTQHQLAQNMTSESKAYGYTLTIWGSGAILLHLLDTPNPLQVFGYVGGALLGFGTLLLFTFDAAVVDSSIGSRTPVPSMLHLLATLGSLVGVYLGARTALTAAVPPTVVFFGGGYLATLAYNLILPLETGLVRAIVSS